MTEDFLKDMIANILMDGHYHHISRKLLTCHRLRTGTRNGNYISQVSHIIIYIHIYIYIYTHTQKERETETETERQTDRKTDRQTENIHTQDRATEILEESAFAKE